MTSIRRFMVIVLLASITLLNFLAALHGYRSSMEKSHQLFDKQLASISQLLMNSGVVQYIPSHNLDVVVAESDGIAYQIWNDNQTLIQRSETLPAHKIVSLEAGYSYANYNGYRWRTFASQNPISKIWIVVAERTDVRYTLAEEVVLNSVIPIVAELPLIGLLIWLVIGWGLKPINRLAAELRNRDPQDLQPLSEENVVDELSVLVESSNELLNRLRQSFERERRFSSDTAHELRTPISALKIHLYNLKTVVPEDNESYQLLNLSIQRMSHMIEQMLILYRTVPEQYVDNFERVDVYALVQNQIIEQYQCFSDKEQLIELDGESFEITADVFSINILLKNLLDNASKYTPVGGNILVSVKQNENHAILAIEDSGCGIAEELYGKVFERYYRISDQKTFDTLGSGLGFSIIHHILDLHNGEIVLDKSCFETGLKVTIILPLDRKKQ